MNKKCAGSAFDVACMTVELLCLGEREGRVCVCVCLSVCECVSVYMFPTVSKIPCDSLVKISD